MGGQPQVMQTKITIPHRRDELLSRQRLLELLEGLLDNRLTIISAPAGYGKTSLLIDFIHFTQWPACWFSLDPLDQDPQRFLAHFITSLTLRYPTFGKSSLAALESMTQDSLNLDALVSMIVNDIDEHIIEHFMVILDDYHLVEESEAVNYFINSFIQAVDENCHLVISSRTLLALPDLPLLVEQSQVGGFSFAELAFQPGEIKQLLLKNNHLPVSDEEATEIARDTEGWITGLLLSSQLLGVEITTRLRLAPVSGVNLYDYLAGQVFEKQPETLQRFLLRTALFEEFDARLCSEVLGEVLGHEEDWPGLMQSVLQQNLFILPVGEQGLSLRYHHLFRDFLQNRMLTERPDEAYKIQTRLADHYLNSGEWERAYILYQKVGNSAAVLTLIQKAGSAMVLRGQLATLAEWLERLPAGTLESHPSLVSLSGTVMVSRGETREGLALFNQAIQSLRRLNQREQLVITLFRRSAVHRLLGEYAQAFTDAEESLSLTLDPPMLDAHLGDVLYTKGMALFYLGNAAEAQVYLGKAITAYQVSGDEPSRAKVLLDAGMVAKTAGQYKEAENAYMEALKYYQTTGNMIWQANLLNNLGVLQHLLRDYEVAINSLEKAIHYAEIGANPRLEAYSLASIGDLYRDLEAVHEASGAYQRARQIAIRVREHFLLFYLLLAESRLARLSGNLAEAQDMLGTAQIIASESGSTSDQNLWRLELAGLALFTNNFQEVIDNLIEGVAFFDAEVYQAESLRGHLYLAVAYFESGDKTKALEMLCHLVPILSASKYSNELIISGREILAFLRKMKADNEFGTILSPLLHEITYFEQRQLPMARRMLRRKSQVVPFAPPKLTIYALGKMQVKLAHHTISSLEWRAPAARDLLYLLLSHPGGLTKDQIGRILWPDLSPIELNLRFKNMIYRLRHIVGRNSILHKDQIYLFNRLVDYEYDVETFRKEITLAQKAEDSAEQIAHLQTAVKVYKGAFLPGTGATWFIIERDSLQKSFISSALALAEFYLASQNFEAAISNGERALKEDRSEETTHCFLMRVYAAMGNRMLIIRQYTQCSKALKELNATPAEETQRLYYRLLHP